MRLSRRAFVTAVALVGRRAGAVVRTPLAGTLRLPEMGPRAVVDAARVSELSESWCAGLLHATIASLSDDGRVEYPLLAERPVVSGDGVEVTLSLKPGVLYGPGVAVTAASVVAAWQRARSSPLGRLALSLLQPLRPVVAVDEHTLRFRLASREGLQPLLLAPSLAPSVFERGRLLSLGAFRLDPTRSGLLVRNGYCPSGGAFLDSVSIEAAVSRTEGLRAFTTRNLEASWWGRSLYGVERPANTLLGSGGAVVGMVPTPGGVVATAGHARAIERVLAPLTGRQGLLRVVDEAVTAGEGVVGTLVQAVASRGGSLLRVARPEGDVVLETVGERAVALFDAAGVRATLVGVGEAHDVRLRAVSPVGVGAHWALASFLAVAAGQTGDEAGASAIVQTAEARRREVMAAVWGRSAAAVIGQWVPSVEMDERVRGARWDAFGRLALDNAWMV